MAEDADVVRRQLATKLRELLRERTMTFDQLASCYSLKQGHSVTQKLKEASGDQKTLALGEFLAQMPEFFDFPAGTKNKVRAASATTAPSPSAAVSIPSAADSTTGVLGGGYRADGGAAASAVTADSYACVSEGATSSKPNNDDGDGGGRLASGGPMKYADVSKSVQSILKEHNGAMPLERIEQIFEERFSNRICDVAGMTVDEYFHRKANVFDFDTSARLVSLKATASASPVVEPLSVKDEAFVVREFETMIEEMGPIVYISSLCGRFVQRNGTSVSSVISARPLELFKRRSDVFLVVGAGNVTLKKNEHLPEVQRLTEKPFTRSQRQARAALEAKLPVPEEITERHVVEEFRRLILADGVDSVYISSLCGRFLQRFKKPVTAIISDKPADFLRAYPDIFVMTGGGNVGLREVLGEDAVSVAANPRAPRATYKEPALTKEQIRDVQMTDAAYRDVYASIVRRGPNYQELVQRLMAVCQQIEQASFLALDEVVLGGAVGKGLLSCHGPQAEIVLVVRQLPRRNFGQWLPHILGTLASVLEAQLAAAGAEQFRLENDHIQFQLSGSESADAIVQVFISPVFSAQEDVLECIRTTPPTERSYVYPALARERCEFVGRQTQHVKMLIRLMSWWVSKQASSSPSSVPSDWVVELVVINAAAQLERTRQQKEQDISQATVDLSELVIACLAGLQALDPTTSRTPASYEPLLSDPLNPFCDLADEGDFQPKELAVAAGSEDRLLLFQREAVVARATLATLQEGDGDEELAAGPPVS
eukprot:TRINITY_DN43665_c0_g1_i1.p1 TRINITY_DN43665_c0_g1~~TRINITY_DN43665_c0_g1_i1.p1  ORF type:complete len:770 (-),score=151.26 TRINITY_DN43665_c0_g1_i1:45-2354(-)